MLIHDKCGSIIYGVIDLNFVYYVGIGKKSTRMGLGEIKFNTRRGTKNAEYFCPICKEKVNMENIKISCEYCGKIHLPEEIFNPIGEWGSVGSIGCKECIEKYIEKEKIKELIPLDKIIKKVWVGD